MSNEASRTGKLPVRTGISYGLGNMAFAVLNTVIGYYLLFYLTDYAGIAPAAVGTMILAARIWDAVNDPIMGTILDNAHPSARWGRARPFVLFGAIPMVVFFVMIFSVPQALSAPLKLVWSYVTYVGFEMSFTVASIAFLSMPMRITLDPDKRVSLAMWVNLLGFPALLIPMVVPAMTSAFGGPSGNTHQAYSWVAIVFAVVAMASVAVTFLGVREKYTHDVREDRISIFKGLGMFLRCGPWVKLAAVTLLMFLFFSINMASMVYYMTYYMKQPKLMAMGGFLAMATVVVALLAVKPLLKRFDKRRVVLLAVAVSIVALVVRVFTHDRSVVGFLITLFLSFISYGAYMVVKMPLLFDAIEYAEHRSGRSAKSIGVTGDTFVAKLAQGLGPAILGYVLQWSGYVAQAPEQSKKLLDNLFAIAVYLPLGCMVVIAVLLLTFDIEGKMPKIREELLQRMQAKPEGTAAPEAAAAETTATDPEP
jgi:glycoside/pentoside/hexuronide:cation symporter, GPH family